jgi:hypothetical protein
MLFLMYKSFYVWRPVFAPANAPEEQAQQIRQAAWRPLEALSSGAYVNFLSDAVEGLPKAKSPPRK